MEIDSTHLILLFIVGLVASVINIVAGGGSYLSMPLLIFTGLPPTIANGTNRVGILIGNLVGSWRFFRASKLKKTDLLYFCLPATLGGIIGSWLATTVNDEFLRIFLAVLMLFGSWSVISRPPVAKGASPLHPNLKISGPVFTLVGTYAGFIQAGAGFFSLAATGMMGYDLKRGNAIKTLMNLCLTVPALTIFTVQGLVDWPSGMILALGMSVGSVVGVRLSQKSEPEHLKKMVALAILISAVMVIRPLLDPTG